MLGHDRPAGGPQLLGLDKLLPEQFVRYIIDLAHGDWASPSSPDNLLRLILRPGTPTHPRLAPGSSIHNSLARNASAKNAGIPIMS